MNDIAELKTLVQKIQRTRATQRAEYISELQNKIWDNDDGRTEQLQNILADVAYDLNFYESDPRDRDEALGYYGDGRLSEIIIKLIDDLDRLAK